MHQWAFVEYIFEYILNTFIKFTNKSYTVSSVLRWIRAGTHEKMHFPLFKDPICIVLIISSFFTSLGYNVPYLYLAALAEKIQPPTEQASYMLSLIGIANTLGRILIGYWSDKPWVNRLFVYNVCLAVCGAGEHKIKAISSIWKHHFFIIIFFDQSHRYIYSLWWHLCAGNLLIGVWTNYRSIWWPEIGYTRWSAGIRESKKCIRLVFAIPRYRVIGQTATRWIIIQIDQFFYGGIPVCWCNDWHQWSDVIHYTATANIHGTKKKIFTENNTDREAAVNTIEIARANEINNN